MKKCKAGTILCALILVVTTASHADPPLRQLSVTRKVSLKPKTYTFRFSLWDEEKDGAMRWSEQKQVKLKSNTLSHVLGSVDPGGNPLVPDSFDAQLWVQVDRQSKGVWKKVGARSPLRAVPYAMMSETVADGAITDARISGAISADKIPSEIARSDQSLSGGDIAGTLLNPTIVRLNGKPLASATPSANQVLKWSGTQWAASEDSGVTYQRVMTVSPAGSNAENGAALLAAMAEITSAGAASPYLLKLEPGIYDLGSSPLAMKQYVDIEGSGREQTIITAGGFQNQSATILGASNAQLRDLRVENSGNAPYAVALDSGTSSPRLRNVALSVASGSTTTAGILSAGGSLALEDVSITASGGVNTRGVQMSATELSLSRVNMNTSGGTTSNAGILTTGGSISARDLSITSSGGNFAYGIYNNGTSTTIDAGTLTVSAGGDSFGIYTHSGGIVDLSDLSMTVSAVNNAYGFRQFSGQTAMHNARVRASSGATENKGSHSTGGTVKLYHSTLEASGGTSAMGFSASGTTISLVGVSATGSSGSSTSYGIYVSGATNPELSGLRGIASGGSSAAGMMFVNVSGSLNHSYAYASGASLVNQGILLSAATNVDLISVTAIADGNQTQRGIAVSASNVRVLNSYVAAAGTNQLMAIYTSDNSSNTVAISNSQLEAIDAPVTGTPIFNNGLAVKVGNSRLSGGANQTSGGSISCVGVVDESFTSAGYTTCPS